MRKLIDVSIKQINIVRLNIFMGRAAVLYRLSANIANIPSYVGLIICYVKSG